MKSKSKVLIGVLLVVAALAYLVLSGFSGNTGYHVSIAELADQGEQLSGDYLQSEGQLVADSVRWDAAKIQLDFVLRDLQDPSKTVTVRYHGTRPDNFGPDTQVVIEGRYREGVFLAEDLQTKCPSKYEAYEPPAAVK